MAFVVQWTPIGPEMSVNLASPEDVQDLMQELATGGRAFNIRVVEDGGEPIMPTASKRPQGD